MNTGLVKAELVAMRARIDELLEKIDGDVDEPSVWRTVAEYAKHANVHPETVRRWIVEGMPATDVKREHGKITGTRRTTRINIDDADQWRLTR